MKDSTIALEVKNVRRIFPDGTVALDDVSFSIHAGEFAVIAGSNGSGKSVLMSLIAGLDEATCGTITLNGCQAGLVFQDADAQILGETPEEDVAFGAKNCGLKNRNFLNVWKTHLCIPVFFTKKMHLRGCFPAEKNAVLP